MLTVVVFDHSLDLGLSSKKRVVSKIQQCTSEA